jgi:hypothetical protein
MRKYVKMKDTKNGGDAGLFPRPSTKFIFREAVPLRMHTASNGTILCKEKLFLRVRTNGHTPGHSHTP